MNSQNGDSNSMTECILNCSTDNSLPQLSTIRKRVEEQPVYFIGTRQLLFVSSFFLGLQQISYLSYFYYQKDLMKVAPSTMMFLQGVVRFSAIINPILGFSLDKYISNSPYIKHVLTACFALMLSQSIIFYNFLLSPSLYYTLQFLSFAVYFFVLVYYNYLLVIKNKEEESKPDPTQRTNYFALYYGFQYAGETIG